jgi:hypothetical protein
MTVAKLLMLVGAILLFLGLILHTAPGLFSWFGRLPGDIRMDDDNRFVFIPITSMIIISLVLSLVLNWWLRR